MNTIRCLEESGEYSSHSKKTHFHQIQFCTGKIILWVLKATYWKPREIWPLHRKKTKMKNYNPKKLSKWKILIFPSLSTSLMLIYLCAFKSINSLNTTFFGKAQNFFSCSKCRKFKGYPATQHYDSSKIWTGNPFLNFAIQGTAIPKGDGWSLFGPLAFLYFT